MENTIPLSARTQTEINRIIDYLVKKSESVARIANRLTLEQLLNKYGVCHYQTIRDNLKKEYNHIVNDYSSLQYFGLIVKAKENGYWKITPLGMKFLKNEVSVPAFVMVQNNRVIDESQAKVFANDFPSLDDLSYYHPRKK